MVALVPVVIGAIAVAGVVIFTRISHDRKQLMAEMRYLIAMLPIFALVWFQVRRALSSKGTWHVSDEGLNFVSKSGRTNWNIPWQAITRMKSTSISLIIQWIDEEKAQRKAVMFMEKPGAQELIRQWRECSNERGNHNDGHPLQT